MLRVVFTLVCAALLAAGVWWRFHEPPASAAPPRVALSPAAPALMPARTANSSVVPAANPAALPADAAPATAPDYRAQFNRADDYWDLAESLYVPARQGDPAAQYWLSRALSYCEGLYDWYFIVHLSNGAVRHRTLDEAQQLTASRPLFTADDVRDIQKRCQRLRSADAPPFGTSREWLD